MRSDEEHVAFDAWLSPAVATGQLALFGDVQQK